jgi:hypothetical protein
MIIPISFSGPFRLLTVVLLLVSNLRESIVLIFKEEILKRKRNELYLHEGTFY